MNLQRVRELTGYVIAGAAAFPMIAYALSYPLAYLLTVLVGIVIAVPTLIAAGQLHRERIARYYEANADAQHQAVLGGDLWFGGFGGFVR